jgi:transposase
VTPVPVHLDAVLPEDHLARLLWAAVERLDVTVFTDGLKVVEGGPGRSADDPRLLVALWWSATSQGVSSGRVLDRLCVEHLAYLWLCGGVSMNYHTLNAFRVHHGAALDDLFTQVLGQLQHVGLVDLQHVAQDGIRVRASAGAASFRRQPTLERCVAEAQAVLAAVQADATVERPGEAPPAAAPSAQQRAARERAARERVERLDAAMAALPAARAAKAAQHKEDEARVSTTDAEARVMKMADGGYRPAYNIELAADTTQRIVTGVAVTNNGTDTGQALPMVTQVEERTGRLPAIWSMDGGFGDLPSIQALAAKGLTVLTPVRQPRNPATDPFLPRPTDAPEVAAWRVRMTTDAAKQTYRWRAATIECVNAQARCRFGLTQLRVRGLAKVRCIALWTALTHNLLAGLRALLAAPMGSHAALA